MMAELHYLFDFRKVLAVAVQKLTTHWQTNSSGDSKYGNWELEVRLGMVNRRSPPHPDQIHNESKQVLIPIHDKGAKFDTNVPAALFLALFDRLYGAADAKAGASKIYYHTHLVCHSDETTVADNHEAEQQYSRKERLMKHQDFERPLWNRALSFDLRIAVAAETVCPLPNCALLRPEERRQRRSIVLRTQPHWRVNFVRIGAAEPYRHQIELELLYVEAFISAKKSYDSVKKQAQVSFDVYFQHFVVEQCVALILKLDELVPNEIKVHLS